jgi:hypothetical protein
VFFLTITQAKVARRKKRRFSHLIRVFLKVEELVHLWVREAALLAEGIVHTYASSQNRVSDKMQH